MKRVLLVTCLTAFCVGLGSVALAGPHDNARFALHVKNNFSPTKTITSLEAYSPAPSAAVGSAGTGPDCLSYAVTRGTNEFPGPHVFLVLGQGGGIGFIGASCGIDYDGTGDPVPAYNGTGISPAFVTFTLCTDGLSFPNGPDNPGPYEGEFPSPAGGLRVTWSTCQNIDQGGIGVHSTIGAFYVYAYGEDVLRVTPNNNLQSGAELGISTCGGGTTNLLDVFPPEVVGATMGAVHFGGDGSQGYTPCGVVPVLPSTWGKIKQQYQDQGE